MPEESLPFDYSKLSPEDQEVLRAFLANDQFETRAPDSDQPPTDTVLEDEMLSIFTGEVEEDIAVLRGGLDEVEHDERVDSPGFHTLQRTAHKISGTAAAIGCDAMSAIAHHIEIIIQLIESEEITLPTGFYALEQALGALQLTLESVKTQEQEDMSPLMELEQELETLLVTLTVKKEKLDQGMDRSGGEAPARPIHALETRSSALYDPRSRLQFDQLIQHTEQLIEQQTAIGHARKQVELAFQELHAAQSRLRRIEAFFSSISMSMVSAASAQTDSGTIASSSLVARILREAAQRTGHTHQVQTKTTPPVIPDDATRWDELEMDRFSETRLLGHALNEAIADVATATAQLERALAHFDTLIGQHMVSAQQIRAGALSLHAIPFSALAQQVEQAVLQVALDNRREIQFEARGETVEIDRHILEILAAPITQVISTQLAASLGEKENMDAVCQVKLAALRQGNEVNIELGFSLSLHGGILHMLQECIQPLHGLVTMQPAGAAGMTFRLHFPQASGLMQGLLVRAWEQQVMIPFSQVQHIDYRQQDDHQLLYTLNALLDLPTASSSEETRDTRTGSQIQPVLRLSSGAPEKQVAVQVDEVIGQVELLIKPLPTALKRPGITGAAIDSAGKILLVLDVPELIRQQRHPRSAHAHNTLREPSEALSQIASSAPKKILIVDDSVSIRRTIGQTLGQKDYIILEARDGLEALEKIEEESPGVLLLDLEMPRMNGFDVLNVLRTRSLLPELKIVLLTSRTSEKHRQHARELGAHAFITKPCSENTLLDTVASLLEDRRSA